MTPAENVMQRACIFPLPCLLSFFLSRYFRQMPRVPAVSVAGLGCKFQRWEHKIETGVRLLNSNRAMVFQRVPLQEVGYCFTNQFSTQHVILFSTEVYVIIYPGYNWLSILIYKYISYLSNNIKWLFCLCLVYKKVIDGSIKNGDST